MGKDVIKCKECGTAITPEEVEAGCSTVCPACADKPGDESCCSQVTSDSKKKSGCCCG
jgi:hypothetical protein